MIKLKIIIIIIIIICAINIIIFIILEGINIKNIIICVINITISIIVQSINIKNIIICDTKIIIFIIIESINTKKYYYLWPQHIVRATQAPGLAMLRAGSAVRPRQGSPSARCPQFQYRTMQSIINSFTVHSIPRYNKTLISFNYS